MEYEVKHNPENQRFEIAIDSHLAVIEYKLQGNMMVFTHTGVPKALEGRGLGSKLARAGLDYTRKHKYQALPLCSFVASYIQKHPEYQDLLK